MVTFLTVAHDLELGVHCARQRRVTARVGLVVAAMVDNDDHAIESIAQRLGRNDVGGHIDVLALRSDQALVQGIEHDHARDFARQLLAHSRNQQRVFLDHVGAAGDEIKRDFLVSRHFVVAPQCLCPFFVAVRAFERAIDDSALQDTALAVFR